MYFLSSKSYLLTKNANQIFFWSKLLFWQQLLTNQVKTKQTMCYISKKKYSKEHFFLPQHWPIVKQDIGCHKSWLDCLTGWGGQSPLSKSRWTVRFLRKLQSSWVRDVSPHQSPLSSSRADTRHREVADIEKLLADLGEARVCSPNNVAIQWCRD